MTSKEQAEALKKLVDILAQEGDQWLLQEPFTWEKSPEWTKGDVVPHPHNLKVTPTEDDLKAGDAIEAIINGSAFNGMFTCVFRDGDFMVLSIPELWDIMVPFCKGAKVYLSNGPDDIYSPGHVNPYYDIYPETRLWVNGERVDPGDLKALAEAGLSRLGQWTKWAHEKHILITRCSPKKSIACIRQEHYPTPDCKRPWPVHGPFWADPTCIFYRE
jgi:hypothetical protein